MVLLLVKSFPLTFEGALQVARAPRCQEELRKMFLSVFLRRKSWRISDARLDDFEFGGRPFRRDRGITLAGLAGSEPVPPSSRTKGAFRLPNAFAESMIKWDRLCCTQKGPARPCANRRLPPPTPRRARRLRRRYEGLHQRPPPISQRFLRARFPAGG